MVYLYLEDVIANAIIELNKIDSSREVLFEVAMFYGEEVLSEIRKYDYFAKMKIGKGAIERFEKKYSDYFTDYHANGKFGYHLNEDKSIELLEVIFRKSLPVELLSAFVLSDAKRFDLSNMQKRLMVEQNNKKEIGKSLLLKNTYQLKRIRIKEKNNIR